MDEPRLRVVRPDPSESIADPDDVVVIPDVTPEENPWASAFHGDRTEHPSAPRPGADATRGRASNSDRRLRAYLHLVEGP